ncbi:hypothetical protein, partial [Rothia koreensis]|uniref:hypothetical protein n=1 Tax=Rothia koreensis TaxID=592378 RepID=UPI001EE866EE
PGSGSAQQRAHELRNRPGAVFWGSIGVVVLGGNPNRRTSRWTGEQPAARPAESAGGQPSGVRSRLSKNCPAL